MKNSAIYTKDMLTGKPLRIEQTDIQMKDWGFSFFVDSEMDALRAAYAYRHNKHGVHVKFAKGAGKFMVSVFNEDAVAAGISDP